MGADGHIAYFDREKVNQIQKEIEEKYNTKEVYFNGYSPEYEVNGKKVLLAYWGDNASWCGWGAEGSQLNDYEENSEAVKEFAKRIATEAIVVEDQEVWT